MDALATPARPAAAANPLAALALDRAEHRREDHAWLRDVRPQARVVLLDAAGDALARADGSLVVLGGGAVPASDWEAAIFLGVGADGAPWFACECAPAGTVPDTGEACRWIGLRHAAAAWPAFDSSLFAYARGLTLWRRRARHCGSCGAPTRAERAGHTMRCTAPDCADQQFPRLDPAIIVLVTDGDRCLLGRQPGWPARRYSALAGFVEPGESLEDAVRREVAEESGVRVAACHYQSSQPWPFPSSLMIGFRAEAADIAITLGDELEDARWFDIDALLAAVAAGELRVATQISIAFRLLQDWVAERRGHAAAAALAD